MRCDDCGGETTRRRDGWLWWWQVGVVDDNDGIISIVMMTKKGRGGYSGQSAGRSNWVHEECVWRNSQGMDDSVWWVYALSLSGGVLRQDKEKSGANLVLVLIFELCLRLYGGGGGVNKRSWQRTKILLLSLLLWAEKAYTTCDDVDVVMGVLIERGKSAVVVVAPIV